MSFGDDMLDKNNLPAHIALIMDGNGRWAKKKFLPRIMGHRGGIKSIKKVVIRANDIGIKFITVYAFSTENWKRSNEEISGIFDLLVEFTLKERAELHKKNVKVIMLGQFEGIPKAAEKAIRDTIEMTKNNTGLVLNLAVNYGSRDELTMATRAIAQQVKEGRISPEEIDEEMISKHLYTGIFNIPDPDLIVRTSGEQRLSNYLLWQVAYSEFVFTDVLWPDYDGDELEKSIIEYQKRNRRFGERKE